MAFLSVAPKTWAFANRSDLLDAASDAVCAQLRSAVERRGCGSLLVPGGEMAGLLFDAPYGRYLPWEDICTRQIGGALPTA